MRIGHYVAVVAGQRGFERNVSGHIQIPLKTIDLLKQAGHAVELITTEFDEARTLPAYLPAGVPVHQVTDARDRGGFTERTGDAGSGVKPLRLLRQIQQIKAIARQRELDLIHFYGHARTAEFAGMLRLAGLKIPTVVTLVSASEGMTVGLKRRLWRRIGAVIVSTGYVQSCCRRAGVHADLLRHGIVRNLLAELGDERTLPCYRVLFWRDLTDLNGADVCLRAYDRLAPKYPAVSFDLAVRPWWQESEGVEQLLARHSNVHLYRFPYPPGISLAKLMAEAICVVLPFRELTLDPQFAILESLAAGVPVVTTDLRSNPEFITSGHNGVLVRVGDVDATTSAIERLLNDRPRAAEMGLHAAENLAANWNWDKYVDQLVAVYRRVLQPSHHPAIS